MANKNWDRLETPPFSSRGESVGAPVASEAAPVAQAPAPAAEAVIPLAELAPREEAVIVAINAGGGGCKLGGCRRRLEALGLRPGLALRLLHNPGCGLILLQVNGTRLALGRGVAAKILVRRTSP